MTCSLCNGSVSTVIELAATPPANELLTTPDQTQDLFDLTLVKCDECQHLQLDTEIPKERLFTNYVYVSDTGAANRDHFRRYADEMIARFAPSFVVDIGSNDGLFLSYFEDHATGSCKVLGVDPASNLTKKVQTFDAFFDAKSASFIKGFCGQPDLITCNNMFAHNRDLGEICTGIKELLAQDGTFVFEVSYALPLLQNNLFDLIYHEHFHHWHLAPMIPFFQRFGLKVVDAETIPTHGGSIRVFVQHDNQFKNPPRDNLDWLLQEEKRRFPKLVNQFKQKVIINKIQMLLLLEKLKESNQTISILGYPAKACTLAYNYALDDSVITDIFDDNDLKIGRYTHKGFEIKSSALIKDLKPDYLLILSWNYAKDLMAKHRDFKGKWIVPFPEPTIL